jgi:hypothetical protein
MELDVNEVAYNNNVRGTFHEISVDGDNKRIRVNVSDPLLSGTISFKYDEIRSLWAKLAELDKESASQINKNFNDTLYDANNLANKISLGNYDDNDEKQKLEDMKNFVVLFSKLIENAKINMITSSQNKQKETLIIQKSSEYEKEMEKKQSFDEEAKKVSEESETKFSKTNFQGDAITFEQLLTKLEDEKNKIKEEEQKRMEELKKEASEKKDPLVVQKPQIKKRIMTENGEQKEVHVNSDFVKVEPLISEEKEMKDFKKRSSALDVIDYSKL